MTSKKTEDVDGTGHNSGKKAAAKKAPAAKVAEQKPAPEVKSPEEKPAGDKAMALSEEAETKLNARLGSFIERIERLEEEKQALADDIKEVFSEAKGTGFDVKTMRTIIRMRKMDTNKRKEAEALLETYMAELGMI